MPTYIQKPDASDISPSWPNTTQFDVDMSTGTGGTGGNDISLNASEVKSASFITVANVPNNNAFEDGGTQTVEISPASAAMTIRIRCRMVRLSSTGTILGVKGAFTAFQVIIATDMTFSPVSPTWTGVALCTDRLAVEWELENTDTMMSATATFETGDVTEEVITDITEDGGSCPGTDTRTILSDAEIASGVVEDTKTISSDAHILGTDTKTILSDGHVTKSDTKTILSDAHVNEVDTKTILSDAHITKVDTKTILSDAEIESGVEQDTKTILSDSHINEVDTKTILSDAHITKSDTKTILSDAHITKVDTKTILSDAHITKVDTKTILSDAEIESDIVQDTKTILSDSHITKSDTKTILSAAHINEVDTKTILSDSHITKEDTKTILSDSHVTKEDTKTILSDAEVAAAVIQDTKTILSDANIAGTDTKTILSDAQIAAVAVPAVDAPVLKGGSRRRKFRQLKIRKIKSR